jgi:hypothetical protein
VPPPDDFLELDLLEMARGEISDLRRQLAQRNRALAEAIKKLEDAEDATFRLKVRLDAVTALVERLQQASQARRPLAPKL